MVQCRLHHRRSIRLKEYDYSQAGLYFVTICCQGKICRFGNIENGVMILNEYGKIAYDEWIKLPERYPRVLLDVFQIMPNHVHGIIGLDDTVGATLAVALNADAQNNAVIQNNAVAQIRAGAQIWAGASPAPTTTTIGNIIGAYKSLVTNKCLEIHKLRNEYMDKLWQRNYYEHIIRDAEAHHKIVTYILNNSANWLNDKFSQ
jgi:REP element-mobilizing transposase RayT